MQKHDDVTPAQVRAARGLIGWNQGDLALAANVSRQTIADFELGKRTPVPNNLVAIKKALEAVGVRFVDETESPLGDGTGRGVRIPARRDRAQDRYGGAVKARTRREGTAGAGSLPAQSPGQVGRLTRQFGLALSPGTTCRSFADDHFRCLSCNT